MPPPASPGAPVEPYVAHLLARLESDLAFLTTAGHLTPASQAAILSHLHTPTVAPSLSPQLSGISATGGRFVPPPPARLNSPLAVASSTPPPPSAPSAPVPASAGTARRVVSCRAVWDYVQNQPDDLPFVKGDTIQLEEEMNADWWRGTCHGKTGMFPSNHVERIGSGPPPPPRPTSMASNNSFASNVGQFSPSTLTPPSTSSLSEKQQHPLYAPPPDDNFRPNNGLNSPFYSPSNTNNNNYNNFNSQPQHNQMQPFQQQGPPQQYRNQQQQVEQGAPPIAAKPKFGSGRLGKSMAQSFAGGLGFGAGVAVAGDIVNSIL